MKRAAKKILTALTALLLLTITAGGQTITLDRFETTSGWSLISSDGVGVRLSTDKGLSGNAVRFDYDFTRGTGYGGIQKLFPIDLPDNYEFSFWIRGESPSNNFEIKFIDSTGNNVWWVNNRNWEFPAEWTQIRIKKRHIAFAWGPAGGDQLDRVDRLEFTIASFVGGSGTIWLDSLQFRPLPPERDSWPLPSLTASSFGKGHHPALAADGSEETAWKSRRAGKASMLIDFMTEREFGGVEIRWVPGMAATGFELLLSHDGVRWEKAYSVTANGDETSFIRLAENEARYLKLNMLKGEKAGSYGISEIKFLDIKESLTLNDFLEYVARNSKPGNLPAYFSGRASYWTISGVNGDVKEALISEDGTVEPEKASFSIEPMILTGNRLYNHSNVTPEQSLGFPGLEADSLFIPSVTWRFSDIEFVTGVSSYGPANTSSCLYTGYSLMNRSDRPAELELLLLVRPFQVNPFYQVLNTIGGAGKIGTLSAAADGTVSLDGKKIISSLPWQEFGAMAWDEGNPVNLIRNGKFPQREAVTDRRRLASGIIKYKITLEPGERKELFLAIPYHDTVSVRPAQESFREAFIAGAGYWQTKVRHIRFNLPEEAKRLTDTWRANLIYILINRDNAGIQPGSRSYDRSWIRDGALTSSALLKSGLRDEVREFIEWYASYQYENGKVPCVVDARGPDPVPENDSHGEMIYLIREYFNFTGDTTFLRRYNNHILRAADYISELTRERMTDHYRNGNDSVRAYYGLVPESISHEGYSAKPMHSYWDDFFTMKGLKDAADIQLILGNMEEYERIAALRDTFRVNLYNSLQLAMKVRNIDYIPGCVELGDFDPTSTTIALTPCNELANLPRPQIYNTFSRYYDFFKARRDGTLDWVNYTPYENRVAGSFVMLDQPEKAHELLAYFLADQRPQGWNHWAEVVWKDERAPRFIGDMPHTWCGSDFINAVRSLFVYENEQEKTLVTGAGLRQEWIDAPGGMSVSGLPTYYGDISYSVERREKSYLFTITGDLSLPANGISIRNFNSSRPPARVIINGEESDDFSRNEIRVESVPAQIEIFYE